MYCKPRLYHQKKLIKGFVLHTSPYHHFMLVICTHDNSPRSPSGGRPQDKPPPRPPDHTGHCVPPLPPCSKVRTYAASQGLLAAFTILLHKSHYFRYYHNHS